jgi:hypothetical protein
MPWFNAHCRVLEEIEIVARHLDDPWSFVCDTERGRPRELTPRFVEQHQALADVHVFETHAAENDRCRAFDATERVALSLRGDEPRAIEELEVMCFQSERASCARAREQIAAARARLAASAGVDGGTDAGVDASP